MKPRSYAVIGVLVLLTIALAMVVRAQTQDPLVGKQAPNFALKDTIGREWKYSSLRGKKVVVLDFGRTACIPCRAMGKDLQRVHAKYWSKGVQVLAMNLDGPDAGERISEYIREEKIKFPILRDVEFKAAEAYNVRTIPYLVIIDRSGKVVLTQNGYRRDQYQFLVNKIEPLLNRSKAK